VAGAGDRDRAEQIARSIAESDAQAWALAALGMAMASAGDHDRAEQITRSITDPDRQAQALTALAKTVGLPSAGRLVGQALAVGSWLIPLTAMAELAPHVVIRVADTLCVGNRQSAAASAPSPSSTDGKAGAPREFS
jgi:alkylated DNA nucleotide flippase Atl1